jgi:hypothetical protein
MKDAGAPDDKGSDDEACEDALERDGDNMEDAGAPDDKGSDDEDSEDDNSNDEGDDEEAADNTTALGFLKLLGVNIDTSEEALDDLAGSKFAEGPKGVESLAAAAAAAAAASTTSTPSRFVYGFTKVTGSFSASLSSGAASLDSWTTVFKIIVEQAKLERNLAKRERDLQVTNRKTKINAIRKAAKATLRKAKTDVSSSHLSLVYSGGMPRTMVDVNAAAPPVRGSVLPNRDSCELLAAEYYEKTGRLTYLARKNAENLTVRCFAEPCCGMMSFSFNFSTSWALLKFEACTCSGPGTVSPATGSTAFPTKALLEIIKPLVHADPSVKHSVLTAALEPYLFRAPCKSLVQSLRAAAKIAVFGDPLTELQMFPAYVAALNDLGHRAEHTYLTKEQMCDRMVEIKRLVNSAPLL